MLRSPMGPLALLALAILAPPGCSLSNVAHDACETDVECAEAFGAGSTCDAGYCSDAGSCETGHDCRIKYGGGACVDGTCKLFVPEEPACPIVEPPDLLSRPLVGDGAPLVIGAIFATDDAKNQATADAVRLAVREIDESTGLADGRAIGLVVCDNGGPGNKAAGDDRTKLDQAALDYLAGTLGVPFLVGPRTSGDALKIVARLVEKKYPTVVISPSATSPELTGVPSRLDAKDPNPLFWRTCPSDALQGKVLAGLVAADPEITTAAVVYTNDAYGKVFQETLGADRTELVAFDASTLGDAGAAAQLASTVAGKNVQAIVIVAVSALDTIALVTAMSAAELGGLRYFLTDGSKDATHLLDPGLPADVAAIIKAAQGTAPASARDEATFDQFAASLGAAFPGVDPTQYSFLAHAYDATFLGAFGTVYAQANSESGSDYDGRDVAAGIARLTAGAPIEVGAVGWPGGKQELTTGGQLDLVGISGDLTLDPSSGEGPAPIEVWAVSDNGATFVTVSTISPTD